MTPHRLSRRNLLVVAAFGGLAVAGAACTTPAASPTAAPPAAPPAAPTTAPAKPTTAPAAATPATKAAAPTAAPTARTFTQATLPYAGAVSIPANVSWVVGVEKGFFKEFGIDLAINYIRGTAALIPAMVNQEGWLGWLATAGTLTSIEKGSGLRLLGGAYTAPSFVFFGRPGLQSMSELEGKSVGTDQPGSLTFNLTEMVISAANLTGKVETVAVGPSPEIFKALVAGKIDAGLGTVTFIPQAEKEGLVTLERLWETFPKYSSAAFVSTTDSISQHRDVIVRGLAGFVKTYRYILNDPASKEDWVRVAQNEFSTEPADAELEWQWYRDNKGFALDLELTQEQVDFMQQLNVENGDQSQVMPLSQIADFSLVKEALALVG